MSQYICNNCNQDVLAPNSLCSRCRTELRTRQVISSVIILGGIATLFIGVYIIITLSSSPKPREVVTTATSQTTPRATTTSTTNPTTAATPVATPKAGGTVDVTLVAQYSDKVQPLLAEIYQEMSTVILDLKNFLSTVNSSKDATQSRRIIDNFREQMKTHETKLQDVNSRLKAITAPPALENQHQKLILGVAKYTLAVQGYIQGLAAYNFKQISASQNELKEADSEIKSSAEEFKNIIGEIIRKS